MKIERMTKIFGFIPSAAAAVMLMGGTASAGIPASDQASLQISLDASTFPQGEPIIVHYKIVNSGVNRVYSTVLQKNREKWFNVEVTDEDGSIAPAAHPLPPVYRGAFTDKAVISANSSYSDSVVLNQWVAPLKPGKYSVLIQAEVFYTEKRDGSDQMLITKQVSFPISITASDTNRFHSEAATACQTIETNTNPAKLELAVKTLFALPEQDALPQWQELAASQNLTDKTREMVAEEVSHLNSLTAADLLAQLCWGDGGQKHAGIPMMVYLSGLWQEGNQAMRQHIEDLASQHGEKKPFVPMAMLD